MLRRHFNPNLTGELLEWKTEIEHEIKMATQTIKSTSRYTYLSLNCHSHKPPPLHLLDHLRKLLITILTLRLKSLQVLPHPLRIRARFRNGKADFHTANNAAKHEYGA